MSNPLSHLPLETVKKIGLWHKNQHENLRLQCSRISELIAGLPDNLVSIDTELSLIKNKLNAHITDLKKSPPADIPEEILESILDAYTESSNMIDSIQSQIDRAKGIIE